jgi:hypothetical protein
MQLNSFQIGQRYNVYIDGRRFLTLNLSKVLGLKRFDNCTPDLGRPGKAFACSI